MQSDGCPLRFVLVVKVLYLVHETSKVKPIFHMLPDFNKIRAHDVL